MSKSIKNLMLVAAASLPIVLGMPDGGKNVDKNKAIEKPSSEFTEVANFLQGNTKKDIKKAGIVTAKEKMEFERLRKESREKRKGKR